MGNIEKDKNMNYDKTKYKIWNWKSPVILHWIINPGLVINELILGQTIPKVMLIEREGNKPFFERSFIPCPHCGETGISALRKCFLGPVLTTRCQKCEKPVSVPLWSGLTIVPMILGFIAGPYLFQNPVEAALFATFCTIITWTVWESFVPLKRR